MKKMKAFAFVLLSLALICLVIFMVYSMLTGPDMKLFKYYSDKESFQVITSKVTSITVGDEAVYITLADSNPNFTGADFQINGKNYEKIIQTDFEKSIKKAIP